MKRRIFALTLALSLALLAACGPKGGDQSSGGQSSSNNSGSDVSTMAPDGSASTSQPDASLPDGSQPDGSENPSAPDGSGSTSSPDGSQPPVEEPQAQASLSLNKNDFTLFKAGATWQLKAKSEPAGGTLNWTSSDEAVATVSDKGLVTAVANGKATITVTDDKTGLTASCIVRCRWEEQKPEDGNSSQGGNSSSGSSSSGGSDSKPSSSVDLQAFYDTNSAAYEMPFMMAADAAALDSYYAGLAAISTEQSVIYYCGMSPAPVGDFALVQVKDSKDVDAVKAIFQARIDYMVGDGNGPGGAWYPGPTTMWEEQSRIVSNGNYVMLIVCEKCDAIVDAFNALF